MANTFITSGKVAAAAIKALNKRAVLAGTVTRDYDGDFAGKIGDTVTVRVEAEATAREYAGTGGITYDDFTEIAIPVQLDKWVYNAAKITDKENALEGSISTRMFGPQVKSISRKLEGYVAAALAGAPYTVDTQADFDLLDPWESTLAAGLILDQNEVDEDNRYLAVGAGVRKAILSDPDLKRVDTSGSSETLRRAIVGNYGGFTVVYSPRLAADKAYAYHRTAFVLATFAPPVPDGAVSGGAAADDGFAMTWIRDYDPDNLSDRSVVQAFAGTAAVVEDDADTFARAVELTALGS